MQNTLIRITSLTTTLLIGLHAADLKGVNLGTWISGPKVSSADLAGKVVIFEYWGVNCPPCRANIPHISELAALADPDRLAVIANHCQGPGRTAEVWKECRGTDKPSVVDGGDLPGSNVSSIPRIFVFDHNGTQVFDGSPGEVDDAMITKLLDAAPGPLVPKGDYHLCKAEIAALSAKSGNVAATLKSLRGKSEKGKDDVKAEAASLLEGVQMYLDKKMAAIVAARTTDPVLAATILNKVLGQVKGDDLGKPFEALLAELKADKAFQAELAAAEKLAAIQAAISKAGLDQGDIPSGKKKDAVAAVQALDSLIKAYAETKAAITAKSIRAKLVD
jgi:thiol-disulfide isomerase/thioredoxin